MLHEVPVTMAHQCQEGNMAAGGCIRIAAACSSDPVACRAFHHSAHSFQPPPSHMCRLVASAASACRSLIHTYNRLEGFVKIIDVLYLTGPGLL